MIIEADLFTPPALNAPNAGDHRIAPGVLQQRAAAEAGCHDYRAHPWGPDDPWAEFAKFDDGDREARHELGSDANEGTT